jgi:hypothetical protein
MASEKQVSANRRNATKSNGLKAQNGKRERRMFTANIYNSLVPNSRRID